MVKKQIKHVIIGIIAAMVMGCFLKVIEQLTGKAVYVLLLNVDYFPIIKNGHMNEPIEFSLHIFVSAILVVILYRLLDKLGIATKIWPYVVASLAIGLLLFFTTVLSDRTPVLHDGEAFYYWMVGHLIYGVLIGCFIYYVEVRRNK